MKMNRSTRNPSRKGEGRISQFGEHSFKA